MSGHEAYCALHGGYFTANESCPYCFELRERKREARLKVIVGVCREDNPTDVDEAYGAGTYARLFPSTVCPVCGGVNVHEWNCSLNVG